MASRGRSAARSSAACADRSVRAGRTRCPSAGARVVRRAAEERTKRRGVRRMADSTSICAIQLRRAIRRRSKICSALSGHRSWLSCGAASGGVGRNLRGAHLPKRSRWRDEFYASTSSVHLAAILRRFPGFSTRPYEVPVRRHYVEAQSSGFLVSAGYRLRAQGRFAEALASYRAALENALRALEDWGNAANAASISARSNCCVGDVRCGHCDTRDG